MSVALAQYAADVRGYGTQSAADVRGRGPCARRYRHICLPLESDFVSERNIKNIGGKTLPDIDPSQVPTCLPGSRGVCEAFWHRRGPGHASEDQLLSAAAAVEGGSDHPLAQAILRRAANVKATKSTGFKNLEGKGAQAEIDGKTVFLGSKLLMTENKIDPRRAWRKIRGIAGRWTDGRSSRCGRQARGFDRHCRCSKTDGGGRDQGAARAASRSHADRRQPRHRRAHCEEVFGSTECSPTCCLATKLTGIRRHEPAPREIVTQVLSALSMIEVAMPPEQAAPKRSGGRA